MCPTVIKEAAILENQLVLLMSFILFVYLFIFGLLFPKEDASIVHAVCLMDPIASDNNDSDAFSWPKIIKSPRAFVMCLTGF